MANIPLYVFGQIYSKEAAFVSFSEIKGLKFVIRSELALEHDFHCLYLQRVFKREAILCVNIHIDWYNMKFFKERFLSSIYISSKIVEHCESTKMIEDYLLIDGIFDFMKTFTEFLLHFSK